MLLSTKIIVPTIVVPYMHRESNYEVHKYDSLRVHIWQEKCSAVIFCMFISVFLCQNIEESFQNTPMAEFFCVQGSPCLYVMNLDLASHVKCVPFDGCILYLPTPTLAFCTCGTNTEMR